MHKMFIVLCVIVIPLQIWSAEPLCGKTWQSAWTLDVKKNQLDVIERRLTNDIACDPPSTKFDNVSVEFLDTKSKILYKKTITLNLFGFSEQFVPGKKISKHEISGPVLVILKYPDSPIIKKAETIRFISLRDSKILGKRKL